MDALSPSDAEVALRSLPRRFRAAIASAATDDESEDALTHRPGPDGKSAIDLVVETIANLGACDHALEQVLTSDDPVVDVSSAPSRPSTTLTAEEALLDLEVMVGQLSDRVGAVPAADWTRSGSVDGRNESIQAIDLVRQSVAESIDHLKATEQTLKAVRGT